MLNRIGGKLIKERTRSVLGDGHQEQVERDDAKGKDILSLLVRANLDTDLHEKYRLSDEDMLSRACFSRCTVYHSINFPSTF